MHERGTGAPLCSYGGSLGTCTKQRTVAAGFPQERTPARSRRSLHGRRTSTLLQQCLLRQKIAPPARCRGRWIPAGAGACTKQKIALQRAGLRFVVTVPAPAEDRSTWGAPRVEPPDALGRIKFALIYGGGCRAWSLRRGRREWSLLMPSGGSSSP